MNDGMFGLPIKAPGALYWFNISFLFLVVTSFMALESGSFAITFVLIALVVMTVLGMRYPLVSAQDVIRTPKGFLVYSLFILIMCDTQTYVFEKPISFSGVMSVVLTGIVSFSLGRSIVIGRLGIEEPPADKAEEDSMYNPEDVGSSPHLK
ncbi:MULTISPECIES: hypothetical protein [Enterobacterales]|nr:MULTISPECIES: hypothetical protein [Enterobacterales]MDI9095104.1 hypothetical protein [Providencia rettgeri]